MTEFITIVILTIIIICIFMNYETKLSELVYVKFKIDNREYLVRNRDDKEDAADLLAKLNKSILKLIEYLELKFPNDDRINRLVTKFNPDKISESIANTKYTSYSVNKGEKIVFCIRSKDENENLVKFNTILFVAIHELAHIMTKSIGHTEEFWDNMKFLLIHAIKKKIYKKVDYKKNPEEYCGTNITDSPLQ